MSDTDKESDLATRDIARALVFDPAGRLLLIEYESVRPIDPADPDARGFWFMPGGGLEPGETHEEACRRELSEEIGVADVELGPLVAVCDGPFHLFRTSRYARERYFVVRLASDVIDTSRLAETEDNPVRGTRWWCLDALAASGERVEPAGLANLAQQIVTGDVPGTPVRLNWRNA
ncbi:NUDIX hydrolase [Methylorubrum sp. SB2]|uniref:NUDIX hydrolase n=1 Tax=Methylorubrum subtropicum TaxID=3138812 RepID=UPI00313DD6AD